jgi:hypothetical protein
MFHRLTIFCRSCERCCRRYFHTLWPSLSLRCGRTKRWGPSKTLARYNGETIPAETGDGVLDPEKKNCDNITRVQERAKMGKWVLINSAT